MPCIDPLAALVDGSMCGIERGSRLSLAWLEGYLTLSYAAEAAVSSDPKITTTVSTQGHVILPKAIRDRRHWHAGTQLVVEDTADGVLLKDAPLFKPTRSEDVMGMLALPMPGVASYAYHRDH